MKTYYYKIKYGFGKTDFVIIAAGPDLEKAIYATREHIPVHLAGKLIHGKYIISIEPDVHSYTGWYRTYEPSSGEDYAQIERDVPREIQGVLQKHYEVVQHLALTDKTDAIGKGTALVEASSQLNLLGN